MLFIFLDPWPYRKMDHSTVGTGIKPSQRRATVTLLHVSWRGTGTKRVPSMVETSGTMLNLRQETYT
jgi:hypothetical protein